MLPGPEIELVCRSEDIKDGQEVTRDRLTISYHFVLNPSPSADDSDGQDQRCPTGGHKNIHSALVLTKDKKRMFTCCEINDNNLEVYLNRPHPQKYKTQKIWAFDHQLFENKDRYVE